MSTGARALNLHAKPHVSAAIKQLRAWVTIAAAVVVLCGLTQALVFCFVQYTDARFAEVRAPARQGLRVISAPTAEAEPANRGVGSESVAGAPERARSQWDIVLRQSSGLACGLGVLGIIALCVLTLLGVVVAGGGCVPGVERVVTAGVWSLMMAFLALPWHALLPAMGIPGVFAGYETMCTVVDAHQAAGGATIGAIGALVQWVAMPLVAAFVAVGICLWFRAGVERGVIITAPSQLDKAIEREVSAMARQGVAPGAPRAVGALNRAIGDTPPGLERALDQAAMSVGAMADEVGTDGSAELSGRRGRSVVDGGFRRLI